jgi:thioester reductase-like protein
VYVGDGAEQALELTVDSWRRLVPALDRVLDLARA